MASESSSSHAASHSGGLGVNDLKPLYEALYSVRTKYRYLGLQLGVDLPTIQGIEADHKNVDDRLLEVLFARLNGVPPLTWGDVVTALRSQTVGAHRLANSIHDSYNIHRSDLNREISDKARHQETKINISSGERQPTLSKKCSEEVESSEKASIDTMHERSVKEESSDPESEEEYLTAQSEEYAHSQEEFSSKATNQPKTAKSESVRYSKQKEEMINKGQKSTPLKGKVSRDQSEIVVKKQHKASQLSHPDTSVEGTAEASDEGQQDSDPEVSEKTTPHKPQLESEDESSSATTSEERSEVTSHDYVRKQKYNEKRPKVNPEKEKQESQKVKHASGKKISSMKEHFSISSSDKQSIRGKSAKKRKYMDNEDRSDLRDTKRPKIYSVTTESPPNRERIDMVKNVRRKRNMSAKSQLKGKLVRSEFLQSQRIQEKHSYPKLYSQEEQVENEEETLQKKATEIPLKQATPSSPSTKDSTVDEDWDSDDDRSEDGEDRDSEQSSSNEEEETEHDDGSSSATSEEEVKETASAKSEESKKEYSTTEGKGITRKRKQKEAKDESDTGCGGGDQGRVIKKHRERSNSPTARGSSQEGSLEQPGFKGKRKVKGKGKGVRICKKGESSSSTETDGSSPECHYNISETESKGLRNIFKRFFGRLCFKMKDPVELATHLQIKNLILYSAMNKLLISPESQQAKAITLVRALQKQIKYRPDRLFTIVEVFLQNAALKEPGKEMLQEIGKYNNTVIFNCCYCIT